MFTVKYKSHGNLFTRVTECVSFNYSHFSVTEGIDMMEDRKLQEPPMAVVNIIYSNEHHEEIIVYHGDTVYVENSHGKTTVILR